MTPAVVRIETWQRRPRREYIALDAGAKRSYFLPTPRLGPLQLVLHAIRDGDRRT